MKNSSIILATILVLFSGCADRAASDFASASPAFAGKAECEATSASGDARTSCPFRNVTGRDATSHNAARHPLALKLRRAARGGSSEWLSDQGLGPWVLYRSVKYNSLG